LKVVHVVEALAGGVHTYFEELSFFFGTAEINESIQTTIIYSSNRDQVDPKRIKDSFSKGVRLIELNMQRELAPLDDLKTIISLKQIIGTLKPDVVHLHSSKAGILGRIACFLLFRKIKIFYSPHGYSFLQTTISNFSRKVYRFIEKNSQRVFGGTTIACGDTEYAIAKKIGKSVLVRNGIAVSSIAKHSASNSNSTLKIGIVGRITAARNPKLFNDIALFFPDLNFVWVGDGELRPILTSSNIQITGWFMDRTTALQQLAKIDIYLQTSLWEGLPIALLEAMALKKPIIATNIIGNKDVVIPAETGFLFTEIQELNSYFDYLKDAKNRIKMGEKGLIRCEEFFDSSKNFKQLMALYRE
jgi:glycosyltransferase involved in cell wall biosynthesis